jgi:hypothetical protein
MKSKFLLTSLLFFLSYNLLLSQDLGSSSKINPNNSNTDIIDVQGNPNAKTVIIGALPSDGSYSNGTRIPGNSYRFQYTEYLITQAEIQAGGFPVGNIIDGLGFNIAFAGNFTQTGRLKIYLKNTSDATYNLGTTWTTSGFTEVCNITNWTVPITVGNYEIYFSGGSSFTYTGGGLYVAWEFSNTNSAGTGSLYAACNCSLTAGIMCSRSNTSLLTNLTASNYRPATRLINNQMVDLAAVTNIYGYEKIAVGHNSSCDYPVRVINNSTTPSTFNLNVSLFDVNNNTTLCNYGTTVNGLLPGTDRLVTMIPLNFPGSGNYEIRATASTVPGENYISNNSKVISVNVSTETMGYQTDYSGGQGYGFQYPEFGILSSKFHTSIQGKVVCARLQIANVAANVGNTIYAVLLDHNGVVVDQSNPLTLNSSHLGTLVTLPFLDPPLFTNSDFYVGLAQTKGGGQYYPLGVYQENPGRSGTFFKCPINGGGMTDLGVSNNIKFGIECDIAPTLAYPAPTNVGVDYTSYNSFNLHWHQPAGAVNSEYWLTTVPNQTPSLGGTVSNNASYNPLTNLNANTHYYIYVRSNYGGFNYSIWTGPYDFKTPCTPQTIPYTETFSGSNVPDLPECIITQNANHDTVSWVATNSYYHDAAPGIVINRNINLAMNDWFFSAPLNLLPGSYKVSFWYRGSNAFVEKIKVTFGTSPVASAMTNPTIFQNEGIISYTFTEASGTFTVTQAGTYFIGWQGYSDSDKHFIAIDDIRVESYNSCPAPTLGGASYTTSSSAMLTWTAAPGVSKYSITFWPAYTSGPGPVINNIANPYYLLSSIMPATDFVYYVRSQCQTNVFSDWAGPYYFHTNQYKSLPYSETFESLPFNDWVTSSSTNQNWGISGNSSAYGFGDKSLFANFYNYGSSVPFYIYSPEFNSSSLTSPRLKFSYAYQTYQSQVDKLQVLYSTDLGITFNVLSTLDGGLLGPLNTAGAGTTSFIPDPSHWQDFEMPLPAGTNMIALKAISACGNNLFIDNFEIFDYAQIKKLNIKAFVEGFYNTSSHSMNVCMNDNFTPQWGNNITDKVNVSLHSATDFSVIIANYADVPMYNSGLIQVPNIPGSLNGSYYIEVIPRNAVPIVSSQPISFSAPSVYYNFTYPENMAYGLDSQKEIIPGVYGMVSGEIDKDEFYFIDLEDLRLEEIDVSVGLVGYLNTDLNGDGIVDVSDLSIIETNAGIGYYLQTP